VATGCDVIRPEFVAGFVVAEGCFVRTGVPPRHAFTVGLGAVDGRLCWELQRFFGVGRVDRHPPRRTGHDGTAIFTVQRRRDLLEVIVPFFDGWLPPSRKQAQFRAWRASLADRYSPDASGRSAAIASQSSFEASDHSRSRS
jgi:hypothetical protein